MTQLALNRFDIPSAKHRNMQITPVLTMMLASSGLSSRLWPYSVASRETLRILEHNAAEATSSGVL
jgi:hypothetical protein